MNTSEFQIWRTENPFIENVLFYPDGQEGRWARIDACWHEKKEGIDLTHHYAFVIDLQNGDLYLDCRIRKIWMKCFLLTLYRPFFGSLKTIYHLTLPLSIPLEISKGILKGLQQGLSKKEIVYKVLRHIKNNFTDIVRTPLYTIALTVATLAAVLIVFFVPSKVYELRALAGRLEFDLNHRENSFWILAPCFQPLDNIANMHLSNYSKKDTVYDLEPTLHGLNNLARAIIKHRQKNRNPFDDYGCLLNKNTPFKSTIFLTL